MPETRVDPTRLQGEALRRWYLRSPEQIELERQAAEARQHRAFFGPMGRADPDPGFTRRSDPAPTNIDPGFIRHPEIAGEQVDPGFSRYPGEPFLWPDEQTGTVAARSSGQPYTALSEGAVLDRGLAGPDDGGDLFDIGSKTPQHRRGWEKRWGMPWPTVPETGEKYHVSHIKPKADGGADTLDNIEPEHPAEHIQRHRESGDFSRWGKRGAAARGTPSRGGPRVRGLGLLGIIPNITGILSGRIRTDTPLHFWYDMIGYPSPDDIPPPPDYV